MTKTKEQLREIMKAARHELTHEESHRYSTKICHRLMKLPEYRHANHIALYHAVRGEVSLHRIWKSAPLHGKYCYFPICRKDELYFAPATPTTNFIESNYGILEPDVAESDYIDIKRLDLVLVPLVAFDPYGVRLGMGKGYYDRAFSSLIYKQSLNISLFGMAYEFQKQAILPSHSWDILLHATVTEKTIYYSNREK